MKRLLAGLVTGLLCIAPVSAQNQPSRIDASAIGGVDYTINGGGSNYGQVFSAGGNSTFSLGYGPTLVSTTAAVVSWNDSGSVYIGSQPATSAGYAAGLNFRSLALATTGVILNSAFGQTADLLEFANFGRAKVVSIVGAQGQVGYPQVTLAGASALVPDFVGAHITITNYGGQLVNGTAATYVDCIATGAAVAQWMVVGSTQILGPAGSTGGCGINH